MRGTVKSVDARGAVITLDGEVEGYLRASEFSRDRVDDLSQHLKVGDAVEAHDHQRGSQDPLASTCRSSAKDQVEQNEAMSKLASDSGSAAPRHHQPGCPAEGQAQRAEADSGTSMTKSELIAQLAERFPQLVAKDADFAVKMILDAMTDAPVARVIASRSADLAALRLNYRPPRVGRNPKSGEKVQVPEK